MESIVNATTQPSQVPIIDMSNKQNTTVSESSEESLLDFSSMFKKNGSIKRPAPKLGQNRKTESSEPNWLLEIPAKLDLTLKDLQQRRYMNDEKWKIMKKTDDVELSPIFALISTINYLIKQNGNENTPLINFSDIKQKLNEQNLLSNEFTRKQIILSCTQLIQKHYQLDSLSSKVNELTEGQQNKGFLNHVLQSQSAKNKAFVYICYGQVLCPIGFQNTPLVPLDAYKILKQINPEKMEMWLIFASPLKSHAPLVIKRWNDVEKEMTSRWPQYLNLEEAKKGRQSWEEKPEEVISSKTKQVSCWIEFTLE